MIGTLQALFGRLFGQSVAGKILGASALVAALSAVARLAAVARDLILAATFGLGDTLDAFFIALMLYQFVISVFLIAFNGAFMPVFVATRERSGRDEAAHLLRGIAALGLGLLVAVTLVVVAGAGLYLPFLAHGFGDAQLALTREVVWLLGPFLLFSGAVTLWGAVINAGQKFALPALTPALNAGISVAALLLFGRQYGVLALAGGMAAGALVEAALLGFVLRRQGLPVLPSWRKLHREVRSVAREYSASVAGAAIMASTVMVDQAMATWLGESAVSALNLGGKIVAFVLMLAAGSLSTAAIPYASQLAASGDAAALRQLADRFMKWVMLASIPLVALLALTAGPLVALVFQRGQFSAEDSAVVAGVHAAFALQIPFYVMNVLLLRVVAALRANHLIFQGAAINLAVKVVANLVLMQIWGVVGIALATTLVYIASFGFLYWRLRAMSARPA
jgi:putative peptidoglycan lipid II flippase